MDKMAVQGGVTLRGEVAASGAKNSVLAVIFATLLGEGRHLIKNVPQLRDIESSKLLMDSLGCETEFKNNEIVIHRGEKIKTLAHYDIVRKMRASILVLGPLLACEGYAEVSLPGGCAIGARPINLHLDALRRMGANIEVSKGYVIAKTKKLQGAVIDFPFATVGGTENILMAATLAEGETVINNAAREPEIVDLADYLRAMGAKIEGDGTSTIRVSGVDKLKAAEHTTIADRIEVGTLLIAAAMTGGEVQVNNCRPEHLAALTEKLRLAGLQVEESKDSLFLKCVSPIGALNLSTEPFPGFPTDLQAQMMALLTQAEGLSTVTENVFENRFMHVHELARMNAKIDIDGRIAKIHGEKGGLVGAPVMATDLRASASLVLAGLVAEGETIVNRIYHLDRGYEKLEEKLTRLGGRVKRIKG